VRIIRYPGPLWRPYAIFGFVIVALSVLFWGPPIMLLIFLGAPRRLQTWWVRVWCGFVLKMFGVRVEIEGRENHDPSKPSLVVSNHQSLLDIPAAFAAIDGDIRIVAKKELFTIPVFGQAAGLHEFIPIERGNQTSGRDAAKLIGARIRSGLHVWVAPEGTRSTGPELLPFKKGAFAVAIEAGVPVQPIVVMNSYEVVPKGSLLTRPGTIIRVRVLPRVDTSGYTLNDRAALAERVRSLMAEALEMDRAFYSA
jgi:1-acyl-sn-glycerol-3-phosphate acyltransferase